VAVEDPATALRRKKIETGELIISVGRNEYRNTQVHDSYGCCCCCCHQLGDLYWAITELLDEWVASSDEAKRVADYQARLPLHYFDDTTYESINPYKVFQGEGEQGQLEANVDALGLDLAPEENSTTASRWVGFDVAIR